MEPLKLRSRLCARKILQGRWLHGDVVLPLALFVAPDETSMWGPKEEDF